MSVPFILIASKENYQYLSHPSLPCISYLSSSPLLYRDDNPNFSENFNDFWALEGSNLNTSNGCLRICPILCLTSFPAYFPNPCPQNFSTSPPPFDTKGWPRQAGFSPGHQPLPGTPHLHFGHKILFTSTFPSLRAHFQWQSPVDCDLYGLLTSLDFDSPYMPIIILFF